MGTVIPLHAPNDCEDELDRLYSELHQVNDEARRLFLRLVDLEIRVEDGLLVQKGPRKGQPMTRRGRANFTHQLVEAARDAERASARLHTLGRAYETLSGERGWWSLYTVD